MSRAQIDAIDTVRDRLDVPSVHAIGYCVAGTTLAATLAVLAGKRRGGQGHQRHLLHRAGRFRANAGDLKLFIDDSSWRRSAQLTRRQAGYLDGRYMAATFNLLRGAT